MIVEARHEVAPRVTERSTVRSGDVTLAVYASGPPDAPCVVLVHGYPDSARVWDAVRARLDARFRVIAYDVRGAGASSAPRTVAGYRLEQLAGDLAAVTKATCGTRPFHLVGHDWGSVQSWEAVTSPAFEGRIVSFTSISGPSLDYAGVLLREGDRWKSARALLQSMRQMLQSSYIYFFLLPRLPELAWRALWAPTWPAWLRATEGLKTTPDPDLLRNAIDGLGLYRANFVQRIRKPRARAAHAPVQFIVPMRDRYVGPSLSIGLDRWLGPHRRIELDAAHWVLLSHADIVAQSITEFANDLNGSRQS
ncbi:alpha/beta fold hydrolase [Trinickia diaoshuihuensis]|jgi:pimeloyl-ACP methyl ester carboxylesterase|uniref:alpha/beta fold hydrolase n=1 Tax=Trinickia diaoshuihuensis TaxID=2292265 RepID=UPI000E262FA6|nr:alpha/beta fold hydrolase [Trinickia diaoshuihuensis]